MPQSVAIALVIVLVVVLLTVFVVTFILYVKTPAPKGCESQFGPQCASCEQASCQVYHQAEQYYQKKKEEEEASASSGASSERKE